MIIQLIIFLFLFLTSIEGPKRKFEDIGPSNRATTQNNEMTPIDWINRVNDGPNNYTVNDQNVIYCNRCGKNLIGKNNYKTEFFSHENEHKKMEGLRLKKGRKPKKDKNKRFQKMKDIKIKLGNKAKCLTIIKETGYFICEVCKNVRYSVFYGAHFLDVEKHFRNGSRHNKAIQDQNLDENNLPHNLIFPVAKNAEEYYLFCKYENYRNEVFKQQNPENQPTLLNLFPINPSNQENVPQQTEDWLDLRL